MLAVSFQEACPFTHALATPPENDTLNPLPNGASTYGPTLNPQRSASNWRWPRTLAPPATAVTVGAPGVSPMTKPGPSELPWYGAAGGDNSGGGAGGEGEGDGGGGEGVDARLRAPPGTLRG